MRKLIPLLFVAAACSSTSTQITDVYRDPNVTKFDFKRVAAIALVQDPAIRRQAEDEMARKIGPKGVASYTVLTNEDERDPATARRKLQSLGIDGAVTMALLSLREEPMEYKGLISTPGQDFDMYYRPSAVGASGWEKVARIETKVFALAEDKELWSAATKTFNPNDAQKVVASVGDALIKELRNDHLID